MFFRIIILCSILFGFTGMANAQIPGDYDQDRREIAPLLVGTYDLEGVSVTLLSTECVDLQLLESLGEGYSTSPHWQASFKWGEGLDGPSMGCWTPLMEIEPTEINIGLIFWHLNGLRGMAVESLINKKRGSRI